MLLAGVVGAGNGSTFPARSAAQAARRGALLLGGFNQPLSPSEIQSLRERFTVTSERARACEKADYYATKEPPGLARLAEMIEELALYSEHLQRKSGHVMLCIVLFFGLLFLVIALVSLIPTIERDTGMVIARVILRADGVRSVGQTFRRMAPASGCRGRDQADQKPAPWWRTVPAIRCRTCCSAVFVDYNSAVEGCPESVLVHLRLVSERARTTLAGLSG